MISEPEAAAAHYAAARHLSDGDTVAVYDLGGDTFDRRCDTSSARAVGRKTSSRMVGRRGRCWSPGR